RPLPGTRLGLLSRDDGATELLVGGPRIMSGYLADPDATAHALIRLDGQVWLRTGDLVDQTDSGVYLVGRADDQVKIGAVRLSVTEVEADLADLRGVRRAAAVHLPDYGLVAFVEPVDPDCTPATLLDQLRDRVPAARVPRRVECGAGLPLLANGKPDRR